MKKKLTNFFIYFLNEIFAQLVGWTAGLISMDLLEIYFEKSSWRNIYGLWTDKVILTDDEFVYSNIVVSAILGFLVMKVTILIFNYAKEIITIKNIGWYKWNNSSSFINVSIMYQFSLKNNVLLKTV